MNRNLGGRPVRWIGSPSRFFRQKRRYAASRPRATLWHTRPQEFPIRLFPPLRLRMVQRAREGTNRSAAQLTGSGRFGNRGEKCKSSRTDGAGQGSDRRRGDERAACAAPRASFDRWNGLVQSIFATRRSHLGQYVLLSALICHLQS